MVDIDEILAAAIRTAWLQISGPESRSAHHIEVARYVRAALEREGIIITSHPARRAATANVTHCRTPGTSRIRRSERKARWRLLGAAAGKSRIEGALERSGRLGTLNHDQIVILVLEAGRGKVRGAPAPRSAVDFIALEIASACSWKEPSWSEFQISSQFAK
jgi:aspartate aminotransferase-like enzyme